MKKNVNLIGTVTTTLSLFGIASGTIIRVPADYPTIQQGLEAASSGDTVLVASSGSPYNENIIWPNVNGIVLLSESGPDSTIIDGSDTARVITMSPNLDSTTVIDGFTIQNGYVRDGGGIAWYHSSPTISHNTITNNYAEMGGGIYCNYSSSRIISNTITNNSADYCGGLCFDYSPAVLENNTITGNTATYDGGGVCAYFCSPEIKENTITNNSADYRGGAIFCHDASPKIISNTITNNSADYRGGGIFCEYSSLTINYNDIYSNMGYGVYNEDSSVTVDATHNWWGDASGPYHPVLNSGGLGDSVSSYVDFDPWLTGPTAVEEEKVKLSASNAYLLFQNYPNPFNTETQIRYALPKHSTVKLTVYNILGQEVRTLVSEQKKSGYYTISWDGRDSRGVEVESGIYFFRIQAGEYVKTRKMVMVK